MTAQDRGGAGPAGPLPPIRVSAAATFAGLASGLALGIALGGTLAAGPMADIAGPVGALWLRALQMTILPLVAALLFMGITGMAAMASGPAMARRTLALIAAILAGGTLLAAIAVPLLLSAFPAPATVAREFAGISAAAPIRVPDAADFLLSLLPANVVAAAAQEAMLPLVAFVALFALAATRLVPRHREALSTLAEGVAGAMVVIVGWVLWLAPLGVFALAFDLAGRRGTALVAMLAHYVAAVSAVGLAVLLAAYGVAALLGRQSPLRFARAVLPAQAVAISTQSSLASLPAMLAACRALGLRDAGAEFVLPLATAIFRATSPAMNLAVCIYVARLTGTELSAGTIAAGALVALVTTIGSVSLPGTISFAASTAPIAMAMGVPVAPLMLLVAVEMLPDIVRTLGNVTMDVALACAVDVQASSSTSQ